MKHPFGIVSVFLSLTGLLLVTGQPATAAAGTSMSGVVKDASAQNVSNATVFLIPSSDIAEMAKIKMEIKKNATNDEPLEDSLAANKDTYLQGISDGQGIFKIADVADGKYFIYVVPKDNTYLPGGDKSNVAVSAADLKDKDIEILLSGNVPTDATFIGTSKCLKCHKDYSSEKMTLHKLGIRVAGKDSKLQDSSRFPDFDKGLNILKGSFNPDGPFFTRKSPPPVTPIKSILKYVESSSSRG